MAKKGRRPVYHHFYVPLIVRILVSLGHKDTQIIETLKITRETFYKWMREKKELSDSYNGGKKNQLFQVEGALYRSALGCKTVKKSYKGKKGEGLTLVEEVEHSPNQRSIEYILNNKAPKEWGKTTDHTGGIVIHFPNELKKTVTNE